MMDSIKYEIIEILDPSYSLDQLRYLILSHLIEDSDTLLNRSRIDYMYEIDYWLKGNG